MVEEKMTYVLVSTERFIATVTFPVKNKVIDNISKHLTETHEFTDAVLEVTPVQHTVTKEKLENTPAFRFYTLLTHPGNSVYSKNKQHEMQWFLDTSGEKIRAGLRDLRGMIELFNQLRSKADRVIINLLDKSNSSIVRTHLSTVADVSKVLDALSSKLQMQPSPKKVPLFMLEAEVPAAHKPRRREKVGKSKEGGTHRYMSGMSLKVA